MKTDMGGARSARTGVILVALFSALAFSGACSGNDDNPTPSTGGKAQGGARTTGGSDSSSGGSATSGGAGQSGGSAGTGETGGTDAGGEPGTGGTAGAGEGGSGASGGSDVGGGGAGPDNHCPANDLEFLNHPNESQCSKFPNTKARLPLLNADGSLPPLPGS